MKMIRFSDFCWLNGEVEAGRWSRLPFVWVATGNGAGKLCWMVFADLLRTEKNYCVIEHLW